jgi:hypothetical protein
MFLMLKRTLHQKSWVCHMMWVIHYSGLFHDKYNSIIYPFKIFIRVNWITCTIWTAGLIYFYLNNTLASELQDWLQWKGQYLISENKNHKLSMGPGKFKPLTKQNEATKSILKQLEFINMLIKYLTQIYKLLVSYFSNFFLKTIILWGNIKQLKKITQNKSELFFIIAVITM